MTDPYLVETAEVLISTSDGVIRVRRVPLPERLGEFCWRVDKLGAGGQYWPLDVCDVVEQTGLYRWQDKHWKYRS